MCGIVSIVAYGRNAPPVNRDELLAIRDQMWARGPDGEGAWLSGDSRVGLGHRRLAIIDTTDAGLQPMVSRDGNVRIVFNGEIYNYRELRSELQSLGCVFETQSDTEVIIAGWQQWGEQVVERLSGMFTIALWDASRSGLFLARDTFGIKPLYIADDGKTLRAASQVKALMCGGQISTAPSATGHAGFFLWGNVPEPHTMYRDIQAFPAGTWRWIGTDGSGTTRQFADVGQLIADAEDASQLWSAAEVRERFAGAIRDSVRRHLIADVPVGVFLSSGIDSSAIAALATEVSDMPLHTLTLGFEEFRGTPEDETVLAEQFALVLRSEHYTGWVKQSEFEADYAKFIAAMDQPTLDGLNTWFVCKAAKAAGLKVAISGLGGDEVLGGYPSFRQLPAIVRAFGPMGYLPRVVGRMTRRLALPLLPGGVSAKYAGLAEYGSRYTGAYLLRRALYMPWELNQILPQAVVDQGLPRVLDELDSTLPSRPLSTKGKVSLLESQLYMRNQLLRDADWASMAHSIELRVPLVDLQVLAASSRASKMDLALAPTKPLPESISLRRKTGFGIPTRRWMPQRETVPQPRGASRGLRSWSRLMLDEYLAGPLAPQGWTASGELTHPLALLAPEMASRGGVQSYMWRIWEAMTWFATDGTPAIGASLNDKTYALREISAPDTALSGAAGSRLRFIYLAMSRSFRGRFLVIGHLHHAPIGWLLKRLRWVPGYVVVLHGIEAWQEASTLQKKALQEASYVIATTNYTARVCAEINGIARAKFRVIPLCAERSVADPEPGFSLGGEFPVLFVGRLVQVERYKGLEALLEATSNLLVRGVPVTLHVVGDGDDRPRLEQLAQAKGVLEQHLVFHGRVSDQRLQAAYRSAAVFAMPSAKEGFGIVFVEAMRHGLPCIGGNHGGTPEVIRDGYDGFLVDSGDVNTLTQRLAFLYEGAETRLAMGANAVNHFQEEYGFELFRDRWGNLLHTL
jgi:asparagine synthase (glutamine-hydrolysing)